MAQQWNRPALPPPRLTADVYETAGGEAYVLEIAVPGLTTEEITIEATPDNVKVATQRQQDEQDNGRQYIHREQPVRPMARLFEFPTEIDPDNIRATLEHGILKVYVPKAAASRPRVIKVDRAA